MLVHYTSNWYKSKNIHFFVMNKYVQGQSFEYELIQIYLYMNSDGRSII